MLVKKEKKKTSENGNLDLGNILHGAGILNLGNETFSTAKNVRKVLYLFIPFRKRLQSNLSATAFAGIFRAF